MELPDIGDVFEGYRIESVLGEGAFGIVFFARESSGRPVALKVLKPDEGAGYGRDTRARFEREAGILAQLRSPQTVRMEAAGASANGLLFMAFEHLPGQDLRDLLRAEKTLPASVVHHMLVQLLQALDEAHRKGLIHRDLKPENIRVVPRPDDPYAVKLLDFGIARATDHGAPTLTKTGVIVGTPRYMSPEQLRAQPLTPRSDIYSLGMVAIELLLGEHVLTGNTLSAQFDRVLTSNEVHTTQLREQAGPLLGVIKRMTAVNPDERLPSAAAALTNLGVGRPHAAHNTVVERTATPTKPWWIIIALMLAVCAFGAVVLFSDDDAPTTDLPVRRSSGAANALLEPPPTPEPKPIREPAHEPSPDAGRDMALPPIVRPKDVKRSRGCGHDPIDHGVQTEGRDAIYLPQRYTPDDPHPALILVRMDRQTPRELLESSAWREVADRQGFVVLAPDDPNPHFNPLSAIVNPEHGNKVWRDRVAGVAVVEEFAQRHFESLCVDTSRVYVLAIADGVRLVPTLACKSWVTAVAVTSFIPPDIGHFDPCPRPRKPVFSILPGNSPQVPTSIGRTCDGNEHPTGAEQYHGFWARLMNCGEPTSWGDGRATCAEQACAGGNQLVTCIAPGGIGWAGSHLPVSPRCLDEPPAPTYPAEQELWDFFVSTSD